VTNLSHVANLLSSFGYF